jgi:ribosomally synthesized peptide (two-chain TOMM family)
MSIKEIVECLLGAHARGGPVDQAHDTSPAGRDLDRSNFYNFGPAWLRAIALVWSNPAMFEPLKRDPRQFLAAHCAYDLPDGIELTVCDGQDAPNGALSQVDEQHNTDAPSPTRVTLYVPPAPQLEEQAVALATMAVDCFVFPICT